MTTILMHPPGNGATTTVNGRRYVGVAGTPVPVPDFDAAMLEANGWGFANETGTTAQRPKTGLYNGRLYNDTTVGTEIKWDGKAWRHSTTGASV